MIVVKSPRHPMALVHNTMLLLAVCHSRLPTVSVLLAKVFCIHISAFFCAQPRVYKSAHDDFLGLYPHRVASFFASISECLNQVHIALRYIPITYLKYVT